jgi:hypothetical protein
MAPEVLHLILCDELRPDPDNYHRLNIFGLVTSIRSVAPVFPLTHPKLIALLVWMGGQGSGELMLRVVNAQSGTAVFRTRPRQVRFAGAAEEVGGVVFRIQNCTFPATGLYWVEILFAGSPIARQRLFLRP